MSDTSVGHVGPALTELWKASEFARELNRDPWEFAVELRAVLRLGLTASDVRRLMCLGWIRAARETTGPAHKARRFRALTPLVLPDSAALILTDRGRAAATELLRIPPARRPPDVAAAKNLLSAADLAALRLRAGAGLSRPTPPPAPASDDPSGNFTLNLNGPAAEVRTAGSAAAGSPLHADRARPHWDADRRELTYHGELVKRFRVPAPNQIAIIEAFHEEGWPVRIDDPLPPAADIDPKRRINDTIKCLNRNRVTPHLNFVGDGTGKRVGWR